MSINASLDLIIKHNIGDIFTVLDEDGKEFRVIVKPDRDYIGCSLCVLLGELCPHVNCADGKGHHYELLQDSSNEPLNNSTL